MSIISSLSAIYRHCVSAYLGFDILSATVLVLIGLLVLVLVLVLIGLLVLVLVLVLIGLGLVVSGLGLGLKLCGLVYITVNLLLSFHANRTS